jgi:hypothetical protein
MLTTEEKKKIIKKVLKESYQGVSLNEAKTNSNIKNEIRLNLEFYSGLKKTLPKSKLEEAFHTGNQYIDFFLNFMGSVKDFLTTNDIGKWFSTLIQKVASKIFPSFSKNPNDWTDKLSNGVEKIGQILGPKGIAYIIAAWKNKTIKPTQEMINAQLSKASVVYKILLIVLILVGFWKLWMFIQPFYSAALAPKVLISLKMALAKGGFTKAGFNVIGIYNKIQHATHDETKHEIENSLNLAKQSLSKELSSQQRAAKSSVEFVKPTFRPTF